jgi:hypothetical protein
MRWSNHPLDDRRTSAGLVEPQAADDEGSAHELSHSLLVATWLTIVV